MVCADAVKAELGVDIWRKIVYKNLINRKDKIMPKLVCVKCQCELRPETNGTVVIEMAQEKPYKVWKADTWKCPGCGVEVVGGFGQKPFMENFQEKFAEDLQTEIETAQRVVYDYERPQTKGANK